MTNRRAHWSDELIKAVFDAMVPEGTSRPMPDRAYAVIAAVEDWARWEHVPKGTLARLERAEAAIARVRELHGRHDPNCPYGEDCAAAGLCLACREEYPCATIRALDGE